MCLIKADESGVSELIQRIKKPGLRSRGGRFPKPGASGPGKSREDLRLKFGVFKPNGFMPTHIRHPGDLPVIGDGATQPRSRSLIYLCPTQV